MKWLSLSILTEKLSEGSKSLGLRIGRRRRRKKSLYFHFLKTEAKCFRVTSSLTVSRHIFCSQHNSHAAGFVLHHWVCGLNKSVTDMAIIMVAIFIILSCFCKDIGAQKNVVSLTGSSQVLECAANSEETNTYIWDDVSTEPDTRLFIVDRNGVEKDPTSESVEKYNNFEIVSLFPQSVNLVMTPVDMNDEGTYACELLRGGSVESYKLQLEVVAASVDIDYSGNGIFNEGENYTFTCRATGVRSPNVLNITWSTNSVTEMADTSRSENSENSNLKDLTSTFTFMPNRSDTFIKCSITGYVNEGNISKDRITDDMAVDVQYLPSCELHVTGSGVTDSGCMVRLTCECDANPVVETDGYSYFRNNASVDGNSKTVTADMELDTTAQFSCRGSNSVGTGKESVESFTCSGTTTLPTTTIDITTVITPTDTSTDDVNASSTEQPTTAPKEGTVTPTGGDSSALVIALSCTGGVIVVALTAGGIYWWVFKRVPPPDPNKDDLDIDGAPSNGDTSTALYALPSKKEKNKSGVGSDDTPSTGDTSSAPVYGVVDKDKKNKRPDPQPAPRNPPSNKDPERVELQYADIDHGSRAPSNQIHQPSEATEYATVQSVIV